MQALPTQIKWVRDGLLIIGLDTEMQIYSQWSVLQKNSKKSVGFTACTVINADLKTAPLQSFINSSKFDTSENLKNNKTNQVSSLIIPKNHSVMDLHKLNKAASTARNEVTKKGSKQEIMLEDLNENQSNVHTRINKHKNSKNSTRFFDETEILEIAQDSGLFMQAKYFRYLYILKLLVRSFR